MRLAVLAAERDAREAGPEEKRRQGEVEEPIEGIAVERECEAADSQDGREDEPRVAQPARQPDALLRADRDDGDDASEEGDLDGVGVV